MAPEPQGRSGLSDDGDPRGAPRFDPSWSIRQSLGHWSIGFPYSLPRTSLRDLPGLVPMLMLVDRASASGCTPCSTAADGPWIRPTVAIAPVVILVVLLALATPAATIVQSAVGTNVFSRPLARRLVALPRVGGGRGDHRRPPALRLVAVGLAVDGLRRGAVTMLTEDFQRVPLSTLADFADDHPGAVIVDGAAFTPGPLTNFEVDGSMHPTPFRLNVPEQMESPFTIATTARSSRTWPNAPWRRRMVGPSS